ncbi:hypothetical protein [Sphaerisporangium perillae]|uniref:hypothetical protein n=1 Tax=Sphaerisporangium perillae TaxID=2935860 RepID=UPI00200E3084|nr:hypothetical protein [Sphaerisporangium perillae]
MLAGHQLGGGDGRPEQGGHDRPQHRGRRGRHLDLTSGRHRRALGEHVLDRLAQAHPGITFSFDDERASGRGYYSGAGFEIRATTAAGEDLDLGDGGFTTWSADLLSNAKERLLISGLGVERLCGRFGRQ